MHGKGPEMEGRFRREKWHYLVSVVPQHVKLGLLWLLDGLDPTHLDGMDELRHPLALPL